METPRASAPLQPGLYLTATPIGNAADITLRALEILRRADVLLCEDTRSAKRLLALHGVRRPRGGRLLAYHDHSDGKIRAAILDDIEAGAVVALVSEAGTPLVSDPGYKLVRDAIKRGINITCAPGASATLAALSLCGLPTDRFFFAGFTPNKSPARRAFLQRLKDIPATLIFFESPHRLANALKDMALALGEEREAVVARELTKRFEEIRRGSLQELARAYDAAPKGELVVLVAEAADSAPQLSEEIEAQLRDAMQSESLSAAARRIAEASGISRSLLYRRALELRDSETKT